METSRLVADAKRVVNDLKDLAQTWTNAAGTTSWQVIMGDPVLSQELVAGGFKEHMTHEVCLVATPTPWTTATGSGCAATLSAGAIVSDLRNGKVLIATEQGNLRYRVKSCSYEPGGGWVNLMVTLDSDF